MRDPQEQWPFGQCEYFDLLGVTLTDEAREKYSTLWTNVIISTEQPELSMGITLRARASIVENLSTRPGSIPDPSSTVSYHSGADAPFGAQTRRLKRISSSAFRSSTTPNMVSIHGFQPHSDEGLERIIGTWGIMECSG